MFVTTKIFKWELWVIKRYGEQLHEDQILMCDWLFRIDCLLIYGAISMFNIDIFWSFEILI